MRILLADDIDIIWQGIAEIIKQILPDAEVDEFGDGIYAWENLQKQYEAGQKKPYDLVITDMTMCVMHGDELAAKIHGLCPNIPILFETGESQSVLLEKGIQLERCIFKPVKTEDIKAKLDELDTLPLFAISPSINTESEKQEMCESTDEGILKTITGLFVKLFRKK